MFCKLHGYLLHISKKICKVHLECGCFIASNCTFIIKILNLRLDVKDKTLSITASAFLYQLTNLNCNHVSRYMSMNKHRSSTFICKFNVAVSRRKWILLELDKTKQFLKKIVNVGLMYYLSF